MTERFTVRPAPELADRLRGLKAKPSNIAQGQLYTCVKRAAEQLLPEHALKEGHFLAGPMRGVVYRAKQGRLRIFYVVSREKKLVIILEVALRKDGDKNDAYRILERRIRHGDFDDSFAECGHARPEV